MVSIVLLALLASHAAAAPVRVLSPDDTELSTRKLAAIRNILEAKTAHAKVPSNAKLEASSLARPGSPSHSSVKLLESLSDKCIKLLDDEEQFLSKKTKREKEIKDDEEHVKNDELEALGELSHLKGEMKHLQEMMGHIQEDEEMKDEEKKEEMDYVEEEMKPLRADLKEVQKTLKHLTEVTIDMMNEKVALENDAKWYAKQLQSAKCL